MNRLLVSATDRQLQRDTGIPVAYYGILAELSDAPERMLRMSALAEAVEGSQSRLSHAVSRLEAKGWVERKRCPSDGRGWFAVLTDDGHAALAEAAPGHVEYVRANVFDVLTPDQQQQLGEIATVLSEQLRPRVEECLTAECSEAEGPQEEAS